MSKDLTKLADRFRVTDGIGFRLEDRDTAEDGGLGKREGAELLAGEVERLAELQGRLYVDNRWAVLLVLQAIDTGGKDGTIKHVMSGLNPQGVQVTSFKAPGPDELAHDFLWRIHRAVPERGRVGVFNRSHYEEVLVPRVHPEVLRKQRLPAAVTGEHLFRDRLADIAAFEAYLARQGVAILKVFLHISRAEQRRRLLARLEDPAKHWKFDSQDLAERGRWDEYMAAYEDAIRATAAPHAPWYVVPADHKRFAHLVVAAALARAMERLDLKLPEPEDPAALEAARAQLEAED